jgi:peptide deformylase
VSKQSTEFIVALLPIYTFNHPILKKKARSIKSPTPDLAKLADDMLETMRRANGVGLAANQIGSLQRLIVIDMTGSEGIEKFEPLTLCNPVVTDEEGKWVLEEGCLSLPDLRDEVQRAERIRVKYRDRNFDERELDASGMLSRVILHEVDHLNGVLFVDHLNLLKRKLHRGRLNKIDRGELEVEYEVVPNQQKIIG